jgi:hypothetical protein
MGPASRAASTVDAVSCAEVSTGEAVSAGFDVSPGFESIDDESCEGLDASTPWSWARETSTVPSGGVSNTPSVAVLEHPANTKRSPILLDFINYPPFFLSYSQISKMLSKLTSALRALNKRLNKISSSSAFVSYDEMHAKLLQLEARVQKLEEQAQSNPCVDIRRYPWWTPDKNGLGWLT